MHRSFHKHLVAKFIALTASWLAASAWAQELKHQSTPYSVWLDFRALSSPTPPKVALPIWFDSLKTESVAAADGVPSRTIFRLQVRRIVALNADLLLRLFFDDAPNAGITVTGWSETGSNLFQKGPVGSGIGLPDSVNLSLPMVGVDYLEISAPGDGSLVRGVFLASLQPAAIKQPIDYPAGMTVTDAFDNLPATTPKTDDFQLFGRVKATLDTGIMTLTPGKAETGSWQFNLESAPLVAVVSFEILDADPISPPEILVNNQPLGAASIRLPDLADPAYAGITRPLDSNTHFRYTGWLHAQKAIPTTALQSGLNTIVIQLNKESGPVAVRAVELQLKYNAPGLDFTLSNPIP